MRGMLLPQHYYPPLEPHFEAQVKSALDSLDDSESNYEYQSNYSGKQLLCALSEVLRYETLIYSDRIGPHTNKTKIKTINLVSSPRLKRQVIYAGNPLSLVFGRLTRVTRMHCVFNTDFKVRVVESDT